MATVILAPHNDDETLFCAYTAMREHCHICVVTDSYLQPLRGEIGCSADERWAESCAAAAKLGCEISRLGIRDDALTEEDLVARLQEWRLTSEHIYAPAIQGGHIHHDIVGRAAVTVFGDRVVQYTTYSKTELYTRGNVEVAPTPEEWARKKAALGCYESQLRINLPHFQAVAGKSEWLVDPELRCLHLGCGRNIWLGWTNMDKERYGDNTQCDVTDHIHYDENYFDKVYSEDFLEHIPADKRVHVINEIWRVLKPGGTMEHYVPNAGSRNAYGSPSHLSFWNLQCFEHFDIASYRWHKDRQYEGFIGGFTKVKAELVNPMLEEDGVTRHQSLHVIYRSVK